MNNASDQPELPHDPEFVDKIIQQVDQEQAELESLRAFRDDVRTALANERPGNFEHLLAVAMLGKHTTVVGKSRMQALRHAEAKLEKIREYCDGFLTEVSEPITPDEVRESLLQILNEKAP